MTTKRFKLASCASAEQERVPGRRNACAMGGVAAMIDRQTEIGGGS
jgi:hypothetical protein